VEAMLGLPLQETQFYKDAKHEGVASLVLRQLQRRIDAIPTAIEAQVSALPSPLLEELGEALLDFEKLTDLTTWLEQHPAQTDPS
ncbi:MAG: DUF4351 domain-containing protein, partial [Cyanobacteria bacterium J06554_6]